MSSNVLDRRGVRQAHPRDTILRLFAGDRMKRFVEGGDLGRSTLFTECLDDWIDENNPVCVIDIFVDELDLGDFWWGRSEGDWIDPRIIRRLIDSLYTKSEI
jgi:hypothetical protein